jgi:Ca2+-transporting ATPase
MTTVHREGSTTVAYVKGAPDLLLEQCSAVLRGGSRHVLSEAERSEAAAMVHKLGAERLRVLALAEREIDSENPFFASVSPVDAADHLENDLMLLGFVALLDPPRPEVASALAAAGAAGIRTVMITGDHPQTVLVTAGERLDDRHTRARTGRPRRESGCNYSCLLGVPGASGSLPSRW